MMPIFSASLPPSECSDMGKASNRKASEQRVPLTGSFNVSKGHCVPIIVVLHAFYDTVKGCTLHSSLFFKFFDPPVHIVHINSYPSVKSFIQLSVNANAEFLRISLKSETMGICEQAYLSSSCWDPAFNRLCANLVSFAIPTFGVSIFR